MIGIYIHIPFCVRKCHYCDFLSFPAGEAVREQYVQALIRQIKEGAGGAQRRLSASLSAGAFAGLSSDNDTEYHKVTSIFLGGGTPSALTGGQIERILEAVHETFAVQKDAEITIECNPGTVDIKKLQAFRRAGINRLSFGVQAAQNTLLQKLGRIHTWEMFLESWHLSEEVGFENRSVDLMSGLPGQTMEMWEETLLSAAALSPQHISAYGLIIEEGTPFWDLYREDEARRDQGMDPQILPDEETDRAMYQLTREVLAAYGYERYEISNYARNGFESRHNTGYWQRRPYLGFGLGAASQLGEYRFQCTDSLQAFLETYTDTEQKAKGNIIEAFTDVQHLTREDCMEETMFLGLRMTEGISLRAFENRFGTSVKTVYGDVLQNLNRQGLIRMTDTRLQLTDRGIDISNAVLAEFLL